MYQPEKQNKTRQKKKTLVETEKLNSVHILEGLVSGINNLGFHPRKTGEPSKDCEKISNREIKTVQFGQGLVWIFAMTVPFPGKALSLKQSGTDGCPLCGYQNCILDE